MFEIVVSIIMMLPCIWIASWFVDIEDDCFVIVVIVVAIVFYGALYLWMDRLEKKDEEQRRQEQEHRLKQEDEWRRIREKEEERRNNIKDITIDSPLLSLQDVGAFDGYLQAEDCDLRGSKTIAVYRQTGEWIGTVRDFNTDLMDIVVRHNKIPITVKVQKLHRKYLWIRSTVDLNNYM